MARSTAFPTSRRQPKASDRVILELLKCCQPLAWGLAFSFCMPVAAWAQPASPGARLADKLKQCGACHGEDGNSRIENIPSLAGQPEFFVMNQLFLMREGVRKIDAMTPFVKDLKDDELVGLAATGIEFIPQGG